MLSSSSRPKLSRKARIRFDRVGGKRMLLHPERGMLLSDSAAAVLGLCTGERTLAAIIDQLSDSHAAAREVVEADVLAFLRALDERGLLTCDAGESGDGG